MPFQSPNFLTCSGVPALPPPISVQELPPVVLLPKQKKKSHWGRWFFLLIFLALIAIIVPFGYRGYQTYEAVMRVKTSAALAQADLLSKDFTGAQAAVADTETNLAQVTAAMALFGVWRDLPYLQTQFKLLDDTIAAATTAVKGVKDVIDVVASVQQAMDVAGSAQGLSTGIAPNRSFRDLTPEEKRVVLARFAELVPQLHQAREKFKIAGDAWTRIPQGELYAPIRDQLAPFTRALPKLQVQIDEAVSLLDVFLPMAGYPTAKNYLIVLQNADEMRPTGGFLGNVGTVNVDAADVRSLAFQDVYAIDNPVSSVWKEVPPGPIKSNLDVPAWFFRDSNWSPDFPQSAVRMMDFYDRELTMASATHTTPDGLIAFEPGFFTDLLTLTGPITIDGKEFNADNFFTELEYDVEIGFLNQGKPVAQRKEVVAKLGDAIIQKLMDRPASKWGDLLDLFINALDRKNILIYMNDPAEQALLDMHAWSGRTRPTVQDYLWVVDANLAALKTDGVMDKEIRYKVDMTDPAGPLATATLHYKNTNHQITWRYSRYRDYVRVYVPEGSELVTSTGAMLNDITQTGHRVVPGKTDIGHDLGKTVFGAFWAVEPGETRDLTFTYRLPPSVAATFANDKEYQLLVQKQPGTHARLTLDLSFGKNLVSAVPPETPKEYGDQNYRTTATLENDRTFLIRL